MSDRVTGAFIGELIEAGDAQFISRPRLLFQLTEDLRQPLFLTREAVQAAAFLLYRKAKVTVTIEPADEVSE